jgi:predicted Zn-dependent protease
MIADALMRHGDYADAATRLRGAVDKDPRDSAAWLAMASALVGHADGSLSPARSMPSARRRRPILPRRGRRCFWGWRWPDRAV